MENASKALIIAGAILLAILLISLGIMIFNQAQDTVSNSGMSQAELQAFNNKFLKYEGSGKSGSEAKALINEVIASNADDNNTNRQVWVKIIGKDTTSTKNPVTSKISNSTTYDISMKYADETTNMKTRETSMGCIFYIEIKAK